MSGAEVGDAEKRTASSSEEDDDDEDAGEGELKAAYSVTDLLDELDSADEETNQGANPSDAEPAAEPVAEKQVVNISSSVDSENNFHDCVDSTAPVLPKRSQSTAPAENMAKVGKSTNTKSALESSCETTMQENDVYETAEKLVADTKGNAASSGEENGEGKSMWKRKRPVKKRQFRSERRKPDEKPVVAAEEPTTEPAPGSVVQQRRHQYENVALDGLKGSEHDNGELGKSEENLDPASFTQVGRKRITSDISGRMVITGGSQYTDTDEYSQKVQTLERSAEGLVREYGEDVVILEEQRVRGGEEEEEIYEDTVLEEDVIYSDTLVDPGQAPLTEANGEKMRDIDSPGSRSSLTGSGLYESVELQRKTSNTDDDMSWGSSEFSSYDEEGEGEEGGGAGGGAEEPRSPTIIAATVEYKVREQTPQGGGNVLDKLAARLGHRPRSQEVEEADAESIVVEVTLDLDKHPPPQLPPAPEGLSPQQVKRRYIVGSVVDSETSYTTSLRRLIEEYEKPLREAKPPIISRKAINTIFFKIRDILQCHNMFHIELAECINVWDEREEIGNVFTASFSKSMVFDAYSDFVNNHSLAMETVKSLARQKQAFADFLKQRITLSKDRLSLFGLIVKPIQRFPQFILILQDLLKHTAREHHDRLPLQLALTELETLTHRLNESKRESECYNDARTFMGNLVGRHSVKADADRYYIRRDDLYQVVSVNGVNKMKKRALFMLNDQIVCTSVIEKEGGSDVVEKYKYKWSVPVRNVLVVDAEIVTPYEIRSGPGRSTIVSPKLDSSTYNPWKKDVDDMLHDLPIVEQISQLISQLRLPYNDLRYEHVMGIHRSLQLGIRQSSDLDKCVLHLAVPAKSSNRGHYTFQLGSPSLKQEWVMDLRHTKLAQDDNNKPGWLIPESECQSPAHVPVFVKAQPLDVTKQENKIQCAIPILLPSEDGLCGVQHLWVCSNDSRHCQVAVVSLHTAQPYIVESFRGSDSVVTCAELVPGSRCAAREHAFDQDTVWMATEDNEMVVHLVVEEERVDPQLTFDTPGRVTCLRYLNGLLFAGLDDGRLAIYRRDQDGAWRIEEPLLEELSADPISCLHVLGAEVWAASAGNIFKLVVKQPSDDAVTVRKTVVEVSTKPGEEIFCMATAGVGLLVSFRDHAVIRIFHLETFKHLQDTNLASNINKLFGDKELPPEISSELGSVSVTFLLASRGLLWVGTSVGCVLTFPLPRLEGVPQIKGRPNVSYHAHMGPIKFLTPIFCGATPIPSPSVPTSPAQSVSHSLRGSVADCVEDGVSLQSTQEGGGFTFQLDGVTESCSEDNGFVLTEMSVDETHLDDDRFTMSDEFDTGKRYGVFEPPVNKNKWLSTPDLRSVHDSMYSTEDDNDVSFLYRNLLSGTDHEELDNELLEPRLSSKKRRPFSAMPFANKEEMKTYKKAMLMRRGSKYSTLPIVMEDTGADGNGNKKKTSRQLSSPLDLLNESLDNSYQDDSQESLQNDGAFMQSVSLESSVEASGALDPARSLAGRQDSSDSTPVPPDSPSCTGHGSLGDIPSPKIYSHPVFSPSASVESPGPSDENPSVSGVSPGPAAGATSPDKASPGSPHRPASVSTASPPINLGSPTATTAAVKSMIVVSGGDGHINWSQKKPGDSRYEDVCLLLWQYRL